MAQVRQAKPASQCLYHLLKPALASIWLGSKPITLPAGCAGVK